MEFKGEKLFRASIYLYLNLVFTITCCFFIYMREKIKLELKKLAGILDKKASLTRPEYLKAMLLEWFVLCLHPYPFLVGIKIFRYNRFLN